MAVSCELEVHLESRAGLGMSPIAKARTGSTPGSKRVGVDISDSDREKQTTVVEQDDPGEHHRMSNGAVGGSRKSYWEIKLKRERWRSAGRTAQGSPMVEGPIAQH
jgi:hypothetical protein